MAKTEGQGKPISVSMEYLTGGKKAGVVTPSKTGKTPTVGKSNPLPSSNRAKGGKQA